MEGKTFDTRQAVLLLGLFALAAFFWNSPVVYPVKLFTVFLHEMGHGSAALLTGGSFKSVALNSDLSGSALTAGGFYPVVLMSGYLGSMLAGSLLLIISSKTRLDKALSFFLGLAVMLLTVFYVRNTFGLAFGLLSGAGLILLGIYAPERVNDFVLKFIGLTSALYAVIDIKEDLISRTVPSSDAYQMSQALFLPPVFWGILWFLIAVSFTALALFYSLRMKKNI